MKEQNAKNKNKTKQNNKNKKMVKPLLTFSRPRSHTKKSPTAVTSLMLIAFLSCRDNSTLIRWPLPTHTDRHTHTDTHTDTDTHTPKHPHPHTHGHALSSSIVNANKNEES